MRLAFRNGDVIEGDRKAHGCLSCTTVPLIGRFVTHTKDCPDQWRDTQVECKDCRKPFYPPRPSKRRCGCTMEAALEVPDYSWEDRKQRGLECGSCYSGHPRYDLIDEDGDSIHLCHTCGPKQWDGGCYEKMINYREGTVKHK